MKIPRKVMVLNGTLDRETLGFTGEDFVLGVCDALNYSWRGTRSSERGDKGGGFGMGLNSGYDWDAVGDVNRRYCLEPHRPGVYISHLVYLRDRKSVV